MPAKTMQTIKTLFEDETNRFELEAPVTYGKLQTKLRKLYQSKKTTGQAAYTIHYKDDEGDIIVVRSTNELEEAFRVAGNLGQVLKLIISAPAITASSADVQDSGTARPAHGEESEAPKVDPKVSTSDEDTSDEDFVEVGGGSSSSDSGSDCERDPKDRADITIPEPSTIESPNAGQPNHCWRAKCKLVKTDASVGWKNKGSGKFKVFGPPEGGSRANLLQQIRQGKRLRRVEQKQCETAKELLQAICRGKKLSSRRENKPTKDNLLDQIRIGKKLRRVQNYQENLAQKLLRQINRGVKLRKVTVDAPHFAAPNEPVDGTPSTVRHENIRCDGCGQFPIIGNRFKCVTCVDYDLCRSCEVRNAHKHPFLKLREDVHVHKCQVDVSLKLKLMPGAASTPPNCAVVCPQEKATVPAAVPQKAPAEDPTAKADPSAWAFQVLNAMGFYDQAENARLLQAHNGNVQEVVTALLSK
jgi:hypothetical protein